MLIESHNSKLLTISKHRYPLYFVLGRFGKQEEFDFKKKYTILAILAILEVPRSSYYRWLKEGVEKEYSPAEVAIMNLCKETKYRLGHRKIKALLAQKYDIELNRNTVQRLMQIRHLQCRVKPKRKWESQGGTEIVAPNLLGVASGKCRFTT